MESFQVVLRVHSPAVLAASGRAELARALERGDKVVLGHALLQELAEELSRRAGEALIFEVARAGAASAVSGRPPPAARDAVSGRVGEVPGPSAARDAVSGRAPGRRTRRGPCP